MKDWIFNTITKEEIDDFFNKLKREEILHHYGRIYQSIYKIKTERDVDEQEHFLQIALSAIDYQASTYGHSESFITRQTKLFVIERYHPDFSCFENLMDEARRCYHEILLLTMLVPLSRSGKVSVISSLEHFICLRFFMLGKRPEFEDRRSESIRKIVADAAVIRIAEILKFDWMKLFDELPKPRYKIFALFPNGHYHLPGSPATPIESADLPGGDSEI